ncbi:odorant receptor 22c-like isoform X2 [Prorops nasuta]|uniref:odorant receptor 22c-like isoform X2 n=1 Tax=Prorops nasuta TaxID=863751 RepID=UPI0034CD71A5
MDLFFPLNESRPHEFPFYMDHLVDHDKYIVYIYIHIHGIIAVGLTACLAYISTFLVLSLHTAGLFAMLGERLKMVFDHEDKKQLDNSNEAFKNIQSCIERHIEVIKFADFAQSFCEPIIFLQLLGSTFIISTTLVQIIQFEHLRLRCAIFCIAQLFYFLTAAHVSQQIMDSSEGISTNVYCGTWYNQPVRVQKLLLLILRRSHKPCVIHTYNIIVLSMETTRWVTQTIVSYCTLFRQLQQ